MPLNRTHHLDWSGSKGAPRARVAATPEPCVICGRGALLRSPDKDAPVHKVCAEEWMANRGAQ